MKKKISFLLAIIMLCVLLTGCVENEERLNARIDELKAEISQLEEEKILLDSEVVKQKIEKGTSKYILTINIKQVHYSLDLTEHLKDELNDISIQIPVDKEYYDSVEVGDTISDEFRMGSLILKGSFGSWDITVENKEIK